MENKIFKKMLLVGLVGMLLVGMMPSVSADYDSLKVIVTVEDKTYDVGDAVNITVHVFDKGEYVTADDVNITIGYYPLTYVTVTETSTGIYEGTYTIQSTDTYVTISTSVRKGADKDEVSVGVSLDAGLGVKVELDDMSDSSVSPGDDVGITVTVKENDVNVNADNFTLKVDSDEINYTNPGNGVYKGTYTVSSTLTESKTINIHADASKDSKSGSGYGSFSVNFYSVWYHNISVTDTSSSFEIYVADMDGTTVTAASVSFKYNDGTPSTPNVNKTGTTNSNGKAQFSISYSNVYSVWIYGTVNASGNTQHFSGYISVKPYVFTPNEEGLSIINTDTEDWSTYKPGATITRHYTAYVSNVTVPSKEIYYYIVMQGEHWMWNSIIKHGTLTTDSNGDFSLTLDIPSNCGSIGIYFEAAISQTEATVDYEDTDSDDGMVYEEEWDYFHTLGESYDLSDSAVSISTGVLTIGGNTQVTVSVPGATSEDILGVSWVIGEGDIFSLTHQNWACWGGGYDMVPLTKSGDTYTGSIKIPSFMPADAKYTIFAYWYDKDTETTHINHVTLIPGESDSTDGTTDDGTTNGDGGKDEGGGGFIPGFETIILLSGIGISLILIKRKRK